MCNPILSRRPLCGRLFLFCAGLFLLASSAGAASSEGVITPPPATRFHVFLLAGQSNMAGRGKVEAEDRVGDERILVRGADGLWRVAREPLHWDKPGVAGVGPGLAFAREYLSTLPADAVIGLVPAAFGGTKLESWQKGATGEKFWADGRGLFEQAVESAREAARDGSLRAILWNQGESNVGMARNEGGAEYRRLLHALIADLRAELGRPELPFVGATLGPWRTKPAKALNAVVLELPREVENCAVIDTSAPGLAEALRHIEGDEAHYDAASIRLLGRHYAKTLRALAPGGGE